MNTQPQTNQPSELERIVAKYVNRQQWKGETNRIRVLLADDIAKLLSTSQRETELKGRYEGQAEMYNDLWNITQLYPDPAKGTIAIIKAIANYKDKITRLTDRMGANEDLGLPRAKMTRDVDGILRCNCTPECQDPNKRIVELAKILGLVG